VTALGDTPRVGGTPVQLSVTVRIEDGMPVDASLLITVRSAVRGPPADGEHSIAKFSVALIPIDDGLGVRQFWPPQVWSVKAKSAACMPVICRDDRSSDRFAPSTARLRMPRFAVAVPLTGTLPMFSGLDANDRMP
jgi:hypothetical protein